MERKRLIEEIINICFSDILCDKNELMSKIDIGLEEASFIESLINTIVIKTRACKNIDADRIIEILLELENKRLELEYK